MKVRFAPSPTGWLHVGNARIAVANALFARRIGAPLLLRLDDTDRERSRPEYEEGARQDLAWLGIDWDETFRQSERAALYAAAAERLRVAGRLYPCFEGEDELRAKREQALKRGRTPIYDRAMLKLTAEQRATAEANGKRPYWRFLLSGREVEWDDLVLGRRVVKLPSLSDPVLIRADGTPLYTFTSVVDDIDSGVSHIVRGEDHVTNTGIQLDIWQALGGAAARFGHLPLLVDADGGKLSKRLEGLSLRSLRADGVEPAAITAYLARLGSADNPEPIGLAALAETYDLGRISRAPARFDIKQLLALNARVLHGVGFEAVRDRLPTGATEAFWNAVRGNLELLSEAGMWWDVVAGEIDPPDLPAETEFLAAARAALPEVLDEGAWARWTTALKAATGRGGKSLFRPLRLALTGEAHGPELALLLPLMGRERVARRLERAGTVHASVVN